MSLLVIAELTGKEHSNVVVDINKLLKAVRLEAPEFSRLFKMPSGQTANVYYLDKELTITLISGYRWQELEAANQKPALPDFSDPIAMAELYITNEKDSLRLEVQQQVHEKGCGLITLEITV